jgi:hypothetical protein
MKHAASFALVVVGATIGAMVAPAMAGAGDVQVVDVRPRPTAPAERVFFVGESTSREAVLDLRDRLGAEGAWNVNTFFPDHVVVCNLPVASAAALSPPPGFRRLSSGEGLAAVAGPERWAWIADAYARADRTARDGSGPLAPGATGGGFDDVVLTLPPDQALEIHRAVESSWGANEAPRPQPARAPNQNSEFLGGSILANFVFPESDGGAEPQTDTWTDDQLLQAESGAVQAFISWQAFTPMDISVTFNMVERARTAFEPIQHTMVDDNVWLVDTMHNLGWGLTFYQIASIVHEFNEATRSQFHTQWVVTSFIANSQSIVNHRFGGGNANYTAYAMLGGPFMVEPFPAGTDPNGIGQTLVFSKIVQHEVGHTFWTLDEYPGAPGVCGNTSGYLNYPNRNITMTGLGYETRCEEEIPCIMHSATRVGADRPWCRYSLGHLGVIDDNGRSGPDIFEAAPRIVFEPAEAETVTTNNVVLRFRAESQAVPNKNVYQAPAERVNYAAPIRDAWLSLGQGALVRLVPDDGRFDEVVEEFVIPISLSQVGLTAFQIKSGNGFVTTIASKRFYFAGVNYSRVGASPKPGRIDVTWETAGNIFDTAFNIYRLRPGEPLPGTMINDDPVPPAGPGNTGFVPYLFSDRTIEPGLDYRYYVEGVFSLPCDSVTCVYHSQSEIIGQTAMIPLTSGEFVSNVSPNPSNGNITVSIEVPRTYGGPPTAPQRLPTDVQVTVYDVRGHRIRTLEDRGRLDDVLTLHWDGTRENRSRVAAGIYFLRIRAGDAEAVRKVVLLR